MSADLKALTARINKELGDGAIVLGSQINRELVPRITSGSLSIDAALGGGWPVNQITEVVGDESTGKTAIVLKTVAANQALDPDWTCVWIAAEDYDPEWATDLGVDNERVIVVPTNVMEVAYDIALRYLESRNVDAVVLDSLPALVPDDEASSEMEDWQVGLGARLTGKFLRKSRKAMNRSLVEAERPVTMFVINQFREKVGVVYGDNRTTPGGRAKNYFYHVRVEVRRGDWLRDDTLKDEVTKKPLPVGQEIKLKAFKNKTGAPQRQCQVDFYFDYCTTDGVKHYPGDYDLEKDVVSTALVYRVLAKGGGGWVIFGEQKWKGRAALESELAENDELLEQIRTLVLAEAGKKRRPAADDVAAA